MCKGILSKHQECGHAKKFSPVEICELFSTPTGICTVKDVIHTTIVDAPLLCINCFRQTEANVFEVWAEETRQLRKEIVNLSIVWQSEMSVRAREDTERHILTLERRIVDLKKEVFDDIAEFRREQGVWADG